jgi:serine/threonine-protein kinase
MNTKFDQMLSHYRLIEKIGKGGMGVVYRAEDTTLRRPVAIKVLTKGSLAGQDRRARFLREARLAAALNHSSLCSIYEVTETRPGDLKELPTGEPLPEGTPYLVLEFIDGQPLNQVLSKPGSMALEDLLSVALQVAEGLAFAHERQIIHRDLKPGNVILTAGGRAKILDFGLAKHLWPADRDDAVLAQAETISEELTRAGMVVGTVAYMSPEQAKGVSLDSRSDIFSFGIMLYEMVAGQRPFRGDTSETTRLKIIEAEPEPLPELRSGIPPELERIIWRCLRKRPDERYNDTRDLVVALKDLKHGTSPGRVSFVSTAMEEDRHKSIPQSTLTPAHLIRFELALPAGETLDAETSPAVAMSPDGARLVFAARRDGVSRLFLREMKRLQATPIRGTEGASNPCFSPDSRWVAFFAKGKLKKVAVAGGPPRILCDAPDPRGGTWGDDDNIYFTVSPNQGLWKVSSSGGEPSLLTTPDRSRGEISHRWPELIPGSRVLLFTVKTAAIDSFDDALIATLSLDSGKRDVLLEGGSYPQFSPTGHLFFVRDNNLMAVSFDPERLMVKGDPVSLIQDIRTNPYFGSSQVTIAHPGVLAFVPGTPEAFDRFLSLVDREGKAEPLMKRRRSFVGASVSPDGGRVATALEGANVHIWILDMERGTFSRSTFEGDNAMPIWSPDGNCLAFASDRFGRWNLYSKRVDGGEVEQLVESEYDQFPTAWSPDAQFLAFEELNPSTGFDIWVMQLAEQENATKPFVCTPFNERGAKFSPDGRWVVYYSDESGQYEVYLRSFPGGEGKWQVSSHLSQR